MIDALKALLEKHGKLLRVLIDLHCGRDQGLDPDDIEQEVRIKLWKALESDKNLIIAAGARPVPAAAANIAHATPEMKPASIKTTPPCLRGILCWADNA